MRTLAKIAGYSATHSRCWNAALSLLCAVCAVSVPSLVHACPMCFNGDSQNGDAFLYGSLFLMFVPTVAIGGLGYWAYRRIIAADSASMPMPRDGGDGGTGGDVSGPKGGPVVLRVVERR